MRSRVLRTEAPCLLYQVCIRVVSKNERLMRQVTFSWRRVLARLGKLSADFISKSIHCRSNHRVRLSVSKYLAIRVHDRSVVPSTKMLTNFAEAHAKVRSRQVNRNMPWQRNGLCA